MQLLFFLLLAGDLVLTAAALWQISLARSKPSLPPPPPQPVREENPDPMDEGFENIMRFAVKNRGGEPL